MPAGLRRAVSAATQPRGATLSRPRPAAARTRADPRRRLLDAAAELFARHGYHGTSIRDLARELGLTVGALYAHFASKDRLLLAVYAEGVTRIGAAVGTALAAETDPWLRLEAAARAHIEVLLEPSGHARVLTRVLPSDVPAVTAELIALRDAYEARFRRLIADLPLAPGTDSRLLRLVLLGALNATQIWHRPPRAGSGRADAARIARQLVASLRNGVDGGRASEEVAP